MKRAVTFLMALSLLAGLAIPAFAEETEATVPTLTLSADTEALSPEETVTVTLTLDQPISDLNNYQFNVHYDAERFELTDSTVATEPTVVSAPRKDERDGGDCITVSGLSTEGQAVALAEGTTATLTFAPKEEAQPGEAEFTVTAQALPTYADPTQAAELTLVNEAKVTLEEETEVLAGDFNGDGSIKLTDYLLCYYAYKSSRELTAVEAAAADKNGNGTISLAEALSVFYQYKLS